MAYGNNHIIESLSPSTETVWLARKTGAEQIKVRHSSGVNFSGVRIVALLLSNGVDGAVAGVGVFVDLAVSDTLEAACTVQSGPKPADPRE